jgi:hypothetical protein
VDTLLLPTVIEPVATVVDPIVVVDSPVVDDVVAEPPCPPAPPSSGIVNSEPPHPIERHNQAIVRTCLISKSSRTNSNVKLAPGAASAPCKCWSRCGQPRRDAF